MWVNRVVPQINLAWLAFSLGAMSCSLAGIQVSPFHTDQEEGTYEGRTLFYGGGVPTKSSTAQEYENLWQKDVNLFWLIKTGSKTLITLCRYYPVRQDVLSGVSIKKLK